MKRCLAIIGLIAFAQSLGQAQTTAFTFTPNDPVDSASGTDGFRFTSTFNIQVTDLGYYDHNGDGLTLAHTIGLFDFETQELLVSAEADASSFLDGLFRYTEIEPFPLQAGIQYVIAGHHPGTGQQDPAIELLGANMVNSASELQLREYFFSESEELIFPQTSFEPFRFFGPNFRFVLDGDISSIDFNGDGNATCADINSLADAVANNLANAKFDLNNDFQLDISDVELWLSRAGAANGVALTNGDANLNGTIDATDHAAWEVNRFTNGAWCDGDFNADGHIDGSDFNIWNNASQAAATATVPEPSSKTVLLFASLGLLAYRARPIGKHKSDCDRRRD